MSTTDSDRDLRFDLHDLRQRVSLLQDELLDARRRLRSFEENEAVELVALRAQNAALNTRCSKLDARVEELSCWGSGLQNERDALRSRVDELAAWGKGLEAKAGESSGRRRS